MENISKEKNFPLNEVFKNFLQTVTKLKLSTFKRFLKR